LLAFVARRKLGRGRDFVKVEIALGNPLNLDLRLPGSH